MTATLTSVPTRSRPASEAEVHASLAALRWSPQDLDPALPPHVAFGGNEHLVLAVATRERLAALDYDFDALAEVMHRHGWTTLQLVWRETPELVPCPRPLPDRRCHRGPGHRRRGRRLRRLPAHPRRPPALRCLHHPSGGGSRPAQPAPGRGIPHGPARASERAGGAGRGREREHRRGRGLSELAAAALSRARCPAGPG